MNTVRKLRNQENEFFLMLENLEQLVNAIKGELGDYDTILALKAEISRIEQSKLPPEQRRLFGV